MKIVLSYLVLSVIGGLLLVFFAAWTPTPTHATVLQDKLVVAGVFIIICIFGISFTLRPNWIRRLVLTKDDTIKNHAEAFKRTFRGHHPDCKTFDTHRLMYKGKTWCVGCFGLFIGCLISIFLMSLYVLLPFQQPRFILHLMVFLGTFVIMLVYLEVVRRNQHLLMHVLTNGMLVLSFFMITIGIVELSGKGEYGLFTILLCMLWLDTRIRLSKWHHSRLCDSCTEPCKVYVSPIIFSR
jgi:hypothetical protein